MALDLLKWTHVIPAAQKRPGPFGAWLLAQAAGPAARVAAAIMDDIAPTALPRDILGILVARYPVTDTAAPGARQKAALSGDLAAAERRWTAERHPRRADPIDARIAADWHDPDAHIEHRPWIPDAHPLLHSGTCRSCLDRTDDPGRAWRAETVVVASRFTSWEACQECAESQVAVLRGAPLTQVPRPYAARDAARWTIGILDSGVMNSPHW